MIFAAGSRLAVRSVSGFNGRQPFPSAILTHPLLRDNRTVGVSTSLSAGDRVEWKTSQGKTTGKVKKKLTSKTKIKTHTVAASKEDPHNLVESEKTGELAAHKPAALKKR